MVVVECSRGLDLFSLPISTCYMQDHACAVLDDAEFFVIAPANFFVILLSLHLPLHRALRVRYRCWYLAWNMGGSRTS